MLAAEFQPLCLSNAVRRRPIPVTVAEEQFVAYRGEDGSVIAFVDRCPHRGMQLSRGTISNGALTCPYHGWRFDSRGCGTSPGNPKLKPRVERLETREAGGVVWIRRASIVPARLPELAFEGYSLVHRAFVEMDAPLTVVLDNFTEIEHTGPGHWEFGFDLDRLAEVSFDVDLADGRSAAIAKGPQKHLSVMSRWALGVEAGDVLTIGIETLYSPLHATYEWGWQDAKSGREKGPRFKEIAFFAPLGPRRTRLVAFYFWTLADSGRLGVNRLVRHGAAQVIQYEIGLDVNLCSNVVAGSETLKLCHLTRFDGLLRAHRRNLEAEFRV